MTDYTITSPNGGTWTDQLANTATVGRYHDLGFLAEGASGAGNVFKQARPGILPGPPVAAASNIPGAFAVAPTSGLNFNIQPGPAILERNTLSGLYHVQSTAVGTGAVGTADPSQTRVDIVTLDHFDGVLGDNSSTTLTRVHVKAGTPGGGVPAIDVTPGARQILGWWTIPALTTTLTSGMWTDARRSAAVRGAVRVLLPGDALSDPGFDVDELRDTSAIATTGTLDRWNAITSVWETVAVLGIGKNVARYYSTAATALSSTAIQIPYDTAQSTTGLVVASGTNNLTFTLQKTGVWSIAVNWRYGTLSNPGDAFFRLCKSGTEATRYGGSNNATAITNSVGIGCFTVQRYFTVGVDNALSVYAASGATSGATLNVNSELNNIAFIYEGP